MEQYEIEIFQPRTGNGFKVELVKTNNKYQVLTHTTGAY